MHKEIDEQSALALTVMRESIQQNLSHQMSGPVESQSLTAAILSPVSGEIEYLHVTKTTKCSVITNLWHSFNAPI